MEYCQRCIFLNEMFGVCNHPKLEGRAKDAHEKCQGLYKLTWMENKLLTERGYTPYCGNQCSRMPRTFFNGSQFQCPDCGWKSSYSERFIKQYKEKWGIRNKDEKETLIYEK